MFYYSPSSITINQGDIVQFQGMSKEIQDFREKTGNEALWTNSMFSGMPAYLIDVKWDNKLILGIHKIVSLGIPHPINYIFISFISFYIMLIRSKWPVVMWIRSVGTLPWALTGKIIGLT